MFRFENFFYQNKDIYISERLLGQPRSLGLGYHWKQDAERCQRLMKSPERSDEAVEQEMERKRCYQKDTLVAGQWWEPNKD